MVFHIVPIALSWWFSITKLLIRMVNKRLGLIPIVVQIMLVKYGAPTWLSFIIIAWGTVAVSFASMKNVTQFYVLRLLLGVTESGTFPGMWYHMSCFYSGKPQRHSVGQDIMRSLTCRIHCTESRLKKDAENLEKDSLYPLEQLIWRKDSDLSTSSLRICDNSGLR